MSDKKRAYRAPSATPWDDVPESGLSAADRIVRDSQRSIYGFRHQADPGDVAFFNSYRRSACPACGARPVRNGARLDGLIRWRCPSCKTQFTPVTGTIFDNAKLPVAAWADFILQALSFESLSAMTREDRRADTTMPYWMEKLFLTLEGIQDDVVLAGRVWVDEAYWPVASKDAKAYPDGRMPRGLSTNQICIAIATDDNASVMIEAGRGKPSRKRIWDALGTHIAPGSHMVHDKERSHAVLTERLGLKSEQYDAALLKGLPDRLNPMEPANRVCFFVKAMLRSHSGFDRSDIQGYLDLLHVALNPPDDKLEKVALILDRAMRCPKSLRYREFYRDNAR